MSAPAGQEGPAAQPARNAGYTKEYNRKTALRLLRRGPMSRAQLARATGLTRAAVSRIVDGLLAQSLLRELPPRLPARGRSVLPVEVSPRQLFALGLSLARERCRLGLVDLTGAVPFQYEAPAAQADLPWILRHARLLLERVDRQRVLGVGISCPGPLDAAAGRILDPPHFQRWHGVELSAALSQALGLPAHLLHDAAALALRQLEVGDSRDFLVLLVGSGVGSGIVTGGRLLGRSGRFSSELGHTSICFDGPKCACGNRGCLELYAALPRLLAGSPFATWAQLTAQLSTSGQARALLKREAAYLAAGVSNLLSLIELDTVYLAGEILPGAQALSPRLQEELAARGGLRRGGDVRVLPADAPENADILAAGEIVFSRWLNVS